MNPSEVGRSYDMIAHRWKSPDHSLSGMSQHERALQFVVSRLNALDVGCGCNGRFTDLLSENGFDVEGVDISTRMIELARQRNPNMTFYLADICQWELPRKYDFISAWDSIWHVPLEAQPSVLNKLCHGLSDGGVLIFTMGGLDQPEEVNDSTMGPPMYHGTLGIPKTLMLLNHQGCICRHLEYDQHPEPHLYIIAQKA